MSHFTVMVFGDDVEDQLQPFHEFECTGINDEYVIDEDVTEEIQEMIDDDKDLEESLDWYGLSDKIVSDESDIDTDEDHKYGYAIVKDGVLIKAVNRTNPNRQWDWYQIGGRWSGFLKLKEGASGEHGSRSWTNSSEDTPPTHCDSALKRDLDIEGMRNDAGKSAGEAWDSVNAITKGESWESWDSIRERIASVDEAREAFNSQPLVMKLKEANAWDWFGMDEFLVSREEYVSKARSSAISTFAVLKDGEWYEKGDMGWFGISVGDKNQEDWDVEVGKLIDSVSEDTRITIVDCHI